VFPLALLVGHQLLDGGTLPDSISAYYYSQSMHNVFVGFVIALGVLLIFYQYQTADDWVSTIAGLFAMGVALFPPLRDGVTNPDPWQSKVDFIHHTCAGLFIACLGGMALFLFTRSAKTKTPLAVPLAQTRTNLADLAHRLGRTSIERQLRPAHKRYPLDITERKHWRNQIYEGCGIVIALCLALLVLTDRFHAPLSLPIQPQVFWLETLALWAFAVAWIVKGELIVVDADKAPDPVQRAFAWVPGVIRLVQQRFGRGRPEKKTPAVASRSSTGEVPRVRRAR
jgi:hypothetical protein